MFPEHGSRPWRPASAWRRRTIGFWGAARGPARRIWRQRWGAAIHHGKRVRFYNAVDPVNRREQAKRSGQAGAQARPLHQRDAVIVEERGSLPFPTGRWRFTVPSHQPAL